MKPYHGVSDMGGAVAATDQGSSSVYRSGKQLWGGDEFHILIQWIKDDEFDILIQWIKDKNLSWEQLVSITEEKRQGNNLLKSQLWSHRGREGRKRSRRR